MSMTTGTEAGQGATMRAFDQVSARISNASGNPVVTVMSVVMVLAWFATGQHFHWSDTWQLVIQTLATVITLPLLFILQNSHNREAAAVHAKLDAILLAQAGVRHPLHPVSEDEARRIRDVVMAAIEVHGG